MADLPILFSAPMVQALISGHKAQTRRTIIFPGVENVLDFVKVATDKRGRAVYEMKGVDGQFVTRPAGKNFVDYHFSPRVAVGDRLYVREHWRVSQKWDATAPRDLPARTMTVFCAAGGSISNNGDPVAWQPETWPDAGLWPAWVGKHRQAMHMPKWASRITLVVEDVKIERLNDVSREDAIAEGLVRNPLAPVAALGFGCNWTFEGDRRFGSPISAYAALWDHINGAGAWSANPWVVAYTFRVIMGNIDQIPQVAA